MGCWPPAGSSRSWSVRRRTRWPATSRTAGVTAGPTSKVDTALAVLAPVPGRAVPLAQVPDPVFAEAMVGPGTAAVAAGGRSPICPVIALDSAPDRLADLREAGEVRAGDLLFRWT